MTGNQWRRKTPIDIAARNALLARLLAEYAPNTTVLQWACEDLADVRERLPKVRKGSAEHQRLAAIGDDLAEKLESSRTARQTHESAEVGNQTTDALIERTTAMLHTLLRMHDAEQHADEYIERTADAHRHAQAPALESTDAPTTAPAPEPRCPYCHQPLSRCAEIKTTRLDAWRALHYSDPAEIERRNPGPTYSLKELYESNLGLLRPDAPFTTHRESPEPENPTAEMLESLRRAAKGGDPNVR
jgi:hypothetical protein